MSNTTNKKTKNCISNILKYWYLLVLICGICSILAQRASAQQNSGLNLTISPSLIDVTANPGDTIKQKFRIRNNGSQAVPLSIIVNKLDALATNGDVIPVNPQAGDTSPSWFSFDKSDFLASPQEWTDVPFSIVIPKDAAFGYYFALRIGQNTTTGTQNGATTKLLAQIVLPVLVNVRSTNSKAELQLVNFTATKPLFEYLPATFQVTIKNTGNVHLKPTGNIFVRLGGNESAIIDANPSLGAILPGGTRTYTASWNDGFLVQQPNAESKGTHLVINWDKLTHFRIGKYTASVLMVYDNGKRDVPLEATTTFWVLPYVFLIELLGGIIILVIILRFLLKWYVAKEIKKRQGQ